MVYRMGKYGLADWSVFRPHVLGNNSLASLDRTVIDRLKLDYLSTIFEPTGVYSVPQGTGFDELGAGRIIARPQLFQVVSLKAFDMDHVNTAKVFAFKRWGMPGAIQRLDIHLRSASDGGSDVVDNYDVFPFGMPGSVDLLNGFSWKEWAEDLLHWSNVAMSDTPGCIHIAGPVKVSERPWTALSIHSVT